MKKGENPGIKIRPNGSASVQIFFRGRAYYLGVYPSLEKARAVREEAELHKSMGDLPEWALQLMEQYRPPYKASPKARKLRKGSGRIVDREDGSCDLQMQVAKNGYWMGVYPSRDAANAMVREFHRHIDAGDLDTWYMGWREKHDMGPTAHGKYNRKANKGIRRTKSGKYMVATSFDGKYVTIGAHASLTRARAIKAAADRHIFAGDFPAWLRLWKIVHAQDAFLARNYLGDELIVHTPQTKRPRGDEKKGGVYSLPNNRFRALLSVAGKTVYLGIFDDRDKAGAVVADAKRHVADGDFAEWLEARKQDRKTSRKKRK